MLKLACLSANIQLCFSNIACDQMTGIDSPGSPASVGRVSDGKLRQLARANRYFIVNLKLTLSQENVLSPVFLPVVKAKPKLQVS